jgi:hypothetical protein
MQQPWRAPLLTRYQALLKFARDYAVAGRGADPEALRALARAHPGALRDLDRMHITTLQARVDALEAAGSAPWMEASWRYECALRAQLALRADAGPRGASTVRDGITRAALKEVAIALGIAVLQVRTLVLCDDRPEKTKE